MNTKIKLEVPDYVKFIDFLQEAIEKRAVSAALDAGMGGHHHDGGSGLLRSKISFYMAGLNKEIPKEWADLLKDFSFNNQLDKDPEFRDDYAEFLRLKDKFKEIPDGRK